MSLVSIVIPALNEENYISQLVESLMLSENIIAEIFICDAGSTDNTIEIILELEKKYSKVKYFNNKNKYVSYAFNGAYKIATGKYIALLGSHAFYPASYIDKGLVYLESGEADVIGGPLNQQGKGENGKAIALAMSSKFGVGDTEFRTSKEKQYVDSVAFAIYRKSIFEEVGLLNESLNRNQDDELHYRIKANGYKILMVPEMECTYYVRDSFKNLFKQYFGYGLYKPLVFKLVKEGLRIRHLIPAFFVLYLLLMPFAYFLLGPLALFPLVLYLAIAIYITNNTSSSFFIKMKIIYACLILHSSYGSGFLLGLFKKEVPKNDM
jgi:glycosyltransferase involved in cell wall biosynthesis